jgi:hypothetical protein
MRLLCTTCSTRIIIRSSAPLRMYLPRHYRPSLPDTVSQSRTSNPNILSNTSIPPPSKYPLSLGLLRCFSWKPRSIFETISISPYLIDALSHRPLHNTYHTLLTTLLTSPPLPFSYSHLNPYTHHPLLSSERPPVPRSLHSPARARSRRTDPPEPPTLALRKPRPAKPQILAPHRTGSSAS